MWGKVVYAGIFLLIGLVFGLQIFTLRTSVTGDVALESDAFEMGEASTTPSELLFVDPESVREERREFVKKLRSTGRNRRPLYEEYIDVLGANGIIDGIETLWPKCHSQAHDLGKVIFAELQDIGEGLRVCADHCYSGCMHGVLMGAFISVESEDAEGHIEFEALKPALEELCYNNTEMTSSYSPGDCAHGAGHALMFLTNYDIPEAVEGCKEFDDDAMKYYCATGTYMEYVTENDRDDAETKSLFYPCDAYDFPAACSRYKTVHVARRHYSDKGTTSEFVAECEKLEGKFRLGCFHGIGNAHMGILASRRMNFTDICLHGTEDEKFMCIEGAMERMAKYHLARALKVCDDLEGKYNDICLTAVDQGMYNMEKDFTLYFAE